MRNWRAVDFRVKHFVDGFDNVTLWRQTSFPKLFFVRVKVFINFMSWNGNQQKCCLWFTPMPTPQYCMELTFSLHSSWDGWHVSPSPTGNSIFCNTVSTGQWWKCLLYSPEADITPSPPNALHDVYCGQECGSKKFNVHHHILTTPHLYPSCALPLLLQQELLKDAPRRCFFLKTWVSWNDFQLRNNTRGSTTTHGVQQQHMGLWSDDLLPPPPRGSHDRKVIWWQNVFYVCTFAFDFTNF